VDEDDVGLCFRVAVDGRELEPVRVLVYGRLAVVLVPLSSNCRSCWRGIS
jgi:hypothetical protein